MLIFYRILPLVLILSIGVPGCGQKGKLYLPEETKNQAIATKQPEQSKR